MVNESKKGFYVMHKSVPPSVGIQYGKAGDDPGITYEEAVEFVLDHEDFWVLNDQGKVVFYIKSEPRR